MNKIIQYIFLVLMGVLTSCQKPELIEQLPTVEIEGGEARKVPIVFTASIPGMGGAATKAMDHKPDDITSFHLVVFDTLGMYVETAEAELVDSTFTDNHEKNYHKKFKVTLTLSEEPRVIHFIANCPVDQIAYGHEASIIGNMFVENGATAYWSRTVVDHIRVYEFPNVSTDDQTNANDQTQNSNVATLADDPPAGDGITSDDGSHFHPCECLKEQLEHVHLLRNFAEIVVEDVTDNDQFVMKGFTVYNIIEKGTVAPYNNKTQSFQCFVDHDKALESDGETIEEVYDYEDLIAAPHYYEGHALASADLKGLPEDPNDIVWYGHDYTKAASDTLNDKHFFMYERKVSVRTNEEDKWRESPPHVIVKANYGGEECYYKFDLIHILEFKDKDENGEDVVVDREIEYYNILRNFQYRFTITSVDSPGYKTVAEAVAGPSSNNFGSSSTTSKFEEITVAGSNLSVSFTDTTLVDGGDKHKIIFKYLYEPARAGDVAVFDYETDPLNTSEDILITNVTKLSKEGSGTWQEFEITVKEPGKTTLEQTIEVRTPDHNLSRKVRLVLSKKFKMLLGCTPRIFKGIDVPQNVEIKLPPGLTEDMFPLDLAIETRGLTLYPDVTKNSAIGISIPVETGISIIPDKQENNQSSFHYVYRIENYDTYKNVLDKDENNYRIVNTHWLTNTVNNASAVYVANKYFETNDTTWTNVSYAFTDVSISPKSISKGEGVPVSITFKRDTKDTSNPDVTIKLNGLKDAYGNTTLTTTVNSSNTIKIDNLVTTDPEGIVGFTLDNSNYMLASDEVNERFTNSFNGRFNVNSIDAGAGKLVNYTFDIPTYFAGMVVDVSFDGLKPQSEIDGLEYDEIVGSVRKYKFRPSAGKSSYTFALLTTNDYPSLCKVSLKTNDAYYYSSVTSTLNQAMKEFRNLTISNAKQGTGRAVTIEFQLAQNETGAKDINVSLVGMTRNGQSSFAINTGNTGNSGDVSVANGIYTINNVVTSSTDADLKVTLAASDYMAESAECTNRELGSFTAISLNPTSLEPNAEEEVTLKFSSNDFIDGMTVYLELDGLEPVTASPASKAVRSFEYTVRGTGEQTVKLRTTGSTNTSKKCTAQVKAAGFEDSAVAEAVQSNGISLLNKNYTITLKLNHRNPNNYTVTTKITADDNTEITNGSTTNSSYTVTRQPYTFTIVLSDVSISQAKETTKITITSVCTRNTSTYSFTQTYTINELVKEFDGKDDVTIYLGQK